MAWVSSKLRTGFLLLASFLCLGQIKKKNLVSRLLLEQSISITGTFTYILAHSHVLLWGDLHKGWATAEPKR